MPERGPPIELIDLSKRFAGGAAVISQLSLKVEAGELIAVIGPSGCGKSTLLRMAAGLLEPTSGTITPAPGTLHSAFIFQDPTLLAWANIIDNIALPLRIEGIATDLRRERAREWASRLGLDAARNYYPRQLSGGMRMRVSLARALITDPQLLLMDEPFAALDAITRSHLNNELRKLHAAQLWTGLFVTHSVNEAVFLADRILVMPSSATGRISIYDNPLPRDRDRRVREDPLFHQQVAELTARLDPVFQ